MILGILLIILCIVAIIFFVNKNKEYKLSQQEQSGNQESEAIAKRKIEMTYEWLRGKDILLYHKLYNKTIDLVKTPSDRDFEKIFDKYFQDENQGLYDEYIEHKK